MLVPKMPGAWPPPSGPCLMSGTGLSWVTPHPTPGSYKGQDTSCISLCKAVFGLIQPKKGEEGDVRLLATAQKTPGEHEVFFSYVHLCYLLLLLLLFPNWPHLSSASCVLDG